MTIKKTSRTKNVLIYKGFERFWHWTQATLIIFLIITGFEIHSSYEFFGFGKAVQYHNFAAFLFLGLIVFAIFWHFTTGEWRQYIPTKKFLLAQIKYYIVGIFKQAPHPTKKNIISKLNPLQRLAYLGLKILVIPVQVISGLLYFYYKDLTVMGFDLSTIAIFHTMGAFAIIAFVIVHIYLTTTGHTVLSNIRAMITGWEEIEIDEVAISKENYPAIVEDSEMGYYFVNNDGYIQDVNDAWVGIYGYDSADEIVGKHLSITRKEEHLEKLNATLQTILEGGKIRSEIVERLCKNGDIGKHYLTANPVYFEGKIIGMAGFIMDIEKTK